VVPFGLSNAAPNFQSLSGLIKKAVPFKGGESQDKVFNELKDKLMAAQILKSADISQPFEIQTDGSQTGTGAVLQQRDDNGVTRSVAYMWHKLNTAEQKYPTNDRELLAIVQALKCGVPICYNNGSLNDIAATTTRRLAGARADLDW
jgi:RNase H-like domain found in reverse transcriptase